MAEPQWIAEASAIEIHHLQLEQHGGLAGIRDPSLLSSAIHRPLNQWHYARESADLAALAAAYAAGIARNHPFFDGNKRTAAVVCETFLELNGVLLDADDDAWYDAMIKLAAGEISEEELGQWIRGRLKPPAE
jgi:death-on-curing protein